MGIVFLIIFMIIIFNAIASAANAAKQGGAPIQTVVTVAKTCPPHKWRYHEIKDQEGNFVTWKMACDICGPLKPIN